MNANSLPGSILKFNWREKRDVHTTIHSSIGQPVIGDGSQTSMMGLYCQNDVIRKEELDLIPHGWRNICGASISGKRNIIIKIQWQECFRMCGGW